MARIKAKEMNQAISSQQVCSVLEGSEGPAMDSTCIHKLENIFFHFFCL